MVCVIAHAATAWNSKPGPPSLAHDWQDGARHPYSRTLQIREKDRWEPGWAHALVPESHGPLLTMVFVAGSRRRIIRRHLSRYGLRAAAKPVLASCLKPDADSNGAVLQGQIYRLARRLRLSWWVLMLAGRAGLQAHSNQPRQRTPNLPFLDDCRKA